jgi:hypothetical protein
MYVHTTTGPSQRKPPRPGLHLSLLTCQVLDKEPLNYYHTSRNSVCSFSFVIHFLFVHYMSRAVAMPEPGLGRSHSPWPTLERLPTKQSLASSGSNTSVGHPRLVGSLQLTIHKTGHARTSLSHLCIFLSYIQNPRIYRKIPISGSQQMATELGTPIPDTEEHVLFTAPRIISWRAN